MGVLKEYFSFSKRERTGALVLIILIVFIFLLPEFYPEAKVNVDQNEIAEFKRQASKFEALIADSTQGVDTGTNSAHEKSHPGRRQKASLFFFDPNTISADGWRKLGIPERTIGTIQNYLSKGGSFKNPKDLGKIYGLSREKFEELLPFVKIKMGDDDNDDRNKRWSQENRWPNSTLVAFDLNEADTSKFIALPGIGSKLANRIIIFREKLGGFYSVEQVREVYGLPDSTFQKIRTLLMCDSSQVRKININAADETELKNHPYIKRNIATAIVNYRQQHGFYASIDKLMQIDIISADIFQRISPYLKVD